MNQSISSLTTSFQKVTSQDIIASLCVLGSSSIINKIDILLRILVLLSSTKKTIEYKNI